MILVKNLKFIHRFFLNKGAQEKLFGDVSDRKLTLLDVHGCGQKFEISSSFFF